MKRKAAICDVPRETTKNHCNGSSVAIVASTVNGFVEKHPCAEKSNGDARDVEAKCTNESSVKNTSTTSSNVKKAVVEVFGVGICTKPPPEEQNKHRETAKIITMNGSNNTTRNIISSNEKGDLAACQLYRILRLRHRVSPVFLRRNLSLNKRKDSFDSVVQRRRSAGNVEEVCKRLGTSSPQKKPPFPMNFIQVVLRFTYHGITFNDGSNEIISAQNGLEATEVANKVSHLNFTGGKLNLYIYDKSASADLQNVGSLKISLNGNTPVKNGAAKSLAIPLKLPAIDKSDGSFLRATLHLHSITKNGKNGVSVNGSKAHTKSTDFSWDLALKDILKITNIGKGASSESEFEMLLNSATMLGDPFCAATVADFKDRDVKNETHGAIAEAMTDTNFCDIHSYMFSAIGALKFHVGVDVVPNSSVNSGTVNHTSHSSPVSPSRVKKLPNKGGQHSTCKQSLSTSPSSSSQQSSSDPIGSISNTTDDQKLYIIFRFAHKSNRKFVFAQNCRCPWCGARETCVNFLLLHLHTCHPMYTYKVIKKVDDNQTRTWVINVSLSKLSANARDLTSFTFRNRKAKNLPVPFSNVQKWGVDQMNRHLKPVYGKNRKTSFSSKTGLPMPEYQQNIDSDEEPCNLEWQNQFLGGLLDEFVDVSQEEKRMIKLWNDHRMSFNHVSGDSQVPLVLRAFLRDVIGRMTVQELDLPFMGCLILHIYNLFNFGCLDLKNARDSLLIVQCLRSDPVKFLPLLSSQKPQGSST